MVKNFLLVWIDKVIHNDCDNTFTKLEEIVNRIYTFINIDECIDFITDINEEIIFVISFGIYDQEIIYLLDDISQINSIYIFCENKIQDEEWIEKLRKVQGIFTNIQSIYEELKKNIQEYDHNTISMSFLTTIDDQTNKNLDQLNQSFMYSQILKEILLTIDFNQEHITEFIIYCRELFVNNRVELKNIDKIEEEYYQHTPIWWYTYQCFLYSMLNRALRMMEIDIIIKLGFFLCDLQKHIVQLYSKQYIEDDHLDSFIVYRGQGLSQTDFDQLIKTKGGLMSFNNFLSTSKNYQVSLKFARYNTAKPDLIGILFVITIDSSISSTPFANINDVSYYKKEDEILFAMHSIFRIGQIQQLDDNNRLWQVNLTLTSDNDPELSILTECMREETFPNATGWNRLGCLLIKLGEFDKAQQVYDALFKQASTDEEKAYIYQMFAFIKENQGEFEEAVILYEKAMKILQKILPLNHLNFPTSYNNIAGLYDKMGEYLKGLSYYEKALIIYQEILPSDHPFIATLYNNIGLLYNKIGNDSQSLLYHEKAFKIYQKTLPANHPHLATSYDNIGKVLSQMGDYSKALLAYEKALEIDEKILPPNHPDLADSYNNIGLVYKRMGEFSKAFSYYEKALDIKQNILSSNHPSLATCYNNFGLIYEDLGEYAKALSFHEKALEIRQKSLSSNHPQLALSYCGIGMSYYYMDDYLKALEFMEHAVDIGQQTLPANHPHLKQYNLCLEKIKEKLSII